jgi:RNA polymerase sigma factor (sigma-70 family)
VPRAILTPREMTVRGHGGVSERPLSYARAARDTHVVSGRARERAMDDAELRSELACTHNSAFGWALSCCGGDRIAAEEALHDVYVMVLEGRAQFAGTSVFRTWLFGVIRVTALSQRRRSWLRSLILLRNADQVAPQDTEAADAGAARDSRSARLRAALAELPARQREVLHLVFYQDLTVEAAAEVMRVSAGSARTHYARGKARLAKTLAMADL